MSRTVRGAKGPGYEYWSARPGNKGGAGRPGKSTKVQTHRVERRQGVIQARKALQE